MNCAGGASSLAASIARSNNQASRVVARRVWVGIGVAKCWCSCACVSYLGDPPHDYHAHYPSVFSLLETLEIGSRLVCVCWSVLLLERLDSLPCVYFSRPGGRAAGCCCTFVSQRFAPQSKASYSCPVEVFDFF